MTKANGNYGPREPRGLRTASGQRFEVYPHLAQTLATHRKSMTVAELIRAASPKIRSIDADYAAKELPARAALFFRECELRTNGRGGGGAATKPYPVNGGGIVFGDRTPGGEPTLRFDANATRFR